MAARFLSYRSVLYVLGIALLVASGCGSRPTYPKAHLAESLQEILTSDHLDARVRFIDHTLAVQTEYPDALMQRDGQIGIGPAFDEAARKIITALEKAYPDAKCALTFTSPLELLVATILSAQCTDERVNIVTGSLFKKYRTVADYAAAAPKGFEREIQSTGFFRAKTK